MTPAITAVIPTHNRRDLVHRAIESVRRQTVPPAEIVVVDDGSTDGTADSLADHDDVTLLVGANQGASAARNRGWQAASAPWIAFLDSDDEWLPDHLAATVDALGRTDERADLYFSDIQMDGGARQWEWAGFAAESPFELASDGTSWVCAPRQPMGLQASVVRRSALARCGGFHEGLRTREDTHLFLRLGVGRPVCAVNHLGTVMSSDALDRIGRTGSTADVRYWECTVELYADVLGHCTLPALERRALEARLAGAHLRLAQGGAGRGHLWSAFRVAPTSVIGRALGRGAKR